MSMYRLAAGLAFAALALVACTRPIPQPVVQQPPAAPAGEQAVAPERNPPGDIPDDQVFITFASNSEPDQVTGKQIRLENQAYLFHKDGKLATLTRWAPLGADNADQWQLMARSFRWQ